MVKFQFDPRSSIPHVKNARSSSLLSYLITFLLYLFTHTHTQVAAVRKERNAHRVRKALEEVNNNDEDNHQCAEGDENCFWIC